MTSKINHVPSGKIGLPVIFRMWDGEVTAIFPTLPGTNDYTLTCMCYAHIGQHSSCTTDFMSCTSPALPDDYKDLYEELRELYEDNADDVLVIYEKNVSWFFKERKYNVELSRVEAPETLQ